MRAPASSGTADPIGAGSHHGVCYMVADIGTHHGTYQGKEIVNRQVQIGFEIPASRIEIDGVDKPRAMSVWYTFSMFKKAGLYKMIESWTGQAFASQAEADEFDFKTLLGKNALVSSILNANGYDKVTGVSALVAGMPEKTAENEFAYYSIDEHGVNIPDTIHKKLADRIRSSDELKALLNGEPQGQSQEQADNKPFDGMDDIPF